MKTQEWLKNEIKRIDHKGYGAYKDLKGEYDFGEYVLCIDHVQGDPFATPSRVSAEIPNRGNFPQELYATKPRKLALEDELLRGLIRRIGELRSDGGGRDGSGKSGLITVCRPGQEVLERMAVVVDEKMIKVRMEVGFPAYGRSIAGAAMIRILFEDLPELIRKSFFYKSLNAKRLQERADLADDQEAVRKEMDRRGLVAFLADGSILPRESGISQRPLKDAVPFESPDSVAVVLDLPHRGKTRGMGIPEGVTLIVGGGYHGKSTLLNALETGVYNHIPRDGREYVACREDAVKLRAEDGRCIRDTDISMFIRNLPSGADTVHFSTENASGSTSQAAATVEALECSRTFLIDEDTSATNFMVRDSMMAELVEEKKEPISPFIGKVRSLWQDCGVSSVLVVGSQGDYFHTADLVLMMDEYRVFDVTKKAKEIAENAKNPYAKSEAAKKPLGGFLHYRYPGMRVEKVRVHGWDCLSLDKREIDLRFVEQIMNDGQTACIAYFLGYMLSHMADGKKNGRELVDALYKMVEEKGMAFAVPPNYGAGAPQMPRKQEVLSALLRFRGK